MRAVKKLRPLVSRPPVDPEAVHPDNEGDSPRPPPPPSALAAFNIEPSNSDSRRERTASFGIRMPMRLYSPRRTIAHEICRAAGATTDDGYSHSGKDSCGA
jgi:hypothetical protein